MKKSKKFSSIKYTPKENDDKGKSKLHLKAREILRAVFGSNRIYEEVELPDHKLRFDFVIPSHDVAIEVQGRQHFELDPFHYKTRWAYVRAMENDRIKQRWCEKNGVILIHLSYKEVNTWENQIRSKIGSVL